MTVIETAEGRLGDFSYVPIAEKRDNRPTVEERPVQPEDLAPARQETPGAARELLGNSQS